MAYPKRKSIEPEEAFAVAWVRERFGMHPGDSVRLPATSGGIVRVSHQQSGLYQDVEVDLPEEIAVGLRLTNGHPIQLGVLSDGTAKLTPLIYKAEDLFGIAKYNGPPLTIEEMDEAIAQAVVERYLGR